MTTEQEQALKAARKHRAATKAARASRLARAKRGELPWAGSATPATAKPFVEYGRAR